MTLFEDLLHYTIEKKEKLGMVHTPKEIRQQPGSWAKTIDLLDERKEELTAFLGRAGLRNGGSATVISAGAGSSEFIGSATQSILQTGFQRQVISTPTTHLVTHARDVFLPDHEYVLISFARSGNSPESVATYNEANKYAEKLNHIVITCNRHGALAGKTKSDSNAVCVLLPEETNDRSLVMTSSFSSMALAAAGLAWLDKFDDFKTISDSLIKAAERVFSSYGNVIADFASIPFTRACYLGSNTLFGTMQECQLKMLEMSDGKVATRFESFLGLRHGPQVFVDSDCVVIAALATDESVRRYELDLLHELRSKNQGCGVLTICDRKNAEIDETSTHVIELFPDEPGVPDQFRVMTDVIVGQIIATIKCLQLGLRPDTPSASGVISRVVQGVTIYDA